MRLPGDRLLNPGQPEREHAEQEIDAEPDQYESENARIAQADRERNGRHAIGLVTVTPKTQRPPGLECEARCRCHGAGDRRRGAHHR